VIMQGPYDCLDAGGGFRAGKVLSRRRDERFGGG